MVVAAFERAVLASKSYLIALALVEGHYSVDDAAKAAHVEVQSQIDRWGEVEDSKLQSLLKHQSATPGTNQVTTPGISQRTTWTTRMCASGSAVRPCCARLTRRCRWDARKDQTLLQHYSHGKRAVDWPGRGRRCRGACIARAAGRAD